MTTIPSRKNAASPATIAVHVLEAIVIVGVLFGARCTRPTPVVPSSLDQYSQMRTTNPEAYPRKTIRMKNLQRVLDSDLSSRQRMDSFGLLVYLGAEDSTSLARLSSVLDDPASPDELRKAVLSFLIKQNYPGLARYVVPSLARADEDPALRDSILQWLSRNPSPGVLAEIIKLWAAEPSPVSMNEPRYRHIVEQITGRPWDEALIAGINTRQGTRQSTGQSTGQSFPRGSALEILVARLPARALKSRILAIHPETEAMAALQSFSETLDYLPTTKSEFAATATIFKTRLEMISDVSRLARQWRDDYGYKFKIRDFHLLSHLAKDPLRGMLRRTQLILEISRSLATRQHVPYKSAPSPAGRVQTDRFDAQVQSLSIVDLWNIYLLNEMLSRPRMQTALQIVADSVLSRPDAAGSGLVFYRRGQAEAVLYPPLTAGDRLPGPLPVSKAMAQAGRDSLARFYTHFDAVDNTAKAGPSSEELADCRKHSYYGLTVTSVNKYAFCAHYYNPGGQVVSLGKFPFGGLAGQ